MPTKKEMMQDVGEVTYSKLIANDTVEYFQNGVQFIRLHFTDIIKIYSDGKIILNSGGWKNAKTKNRINEYAPEVEIIQKNHIWYVIAKSIKGSTSVEVPFYNGIFYYLQDAAGTISDIGVAYLDKWREIHKRIDKYAKKFAEEWKNGHIGPPDTGDCWFCSMITEDNVPLGEAQGDTSHLESHMEEDYFVPSLLCRAIEKEDGAPIVKDAIARQMYGYELPANIIENEAKRIKDCLRKYLRRQFG